MPKTAIGDDEDADRPARRSARSTQPHDGGEADQAVTGDAAGRVDGRMADADPSSVSAVATRGEEPPAAAGVPTATLPPWRALRVAIIDDAMLPPSLDRLGEAAASAVGELLGTNEEALAELEAMGCAADSTADERLRALAESSGPSATLALLGAVSGDAARMVEEHRSFRRLRGILEEEVQDVTVCNPFEGLPDLTASNLILLDYYLEGPAGGRALSVAVATAIRGQPGRAADQQIVLMSSLETVRDARGEFRSDTDLAGSAFAFIGKSDLNERWKVKAHLGMLERARPYAPAFTDYRMGLDQALTSAREDLLGLVDDLDIGDYAFLQSRALMKDGHPLGDYVFWLLSSQLMALAFERDEMRERQRVLDRLEFVGAPFAATEPSKVVASFLHSALVSRNVGPLAAHPRARKGSSYATFPLVQLGDVFLDANRTKAVVVMSADCDLAFSPVSDREPDPETPVMLVPGRPVKMKDAKDGPDPNTDGLLHREDVYRIVWDFAKYRSVALGDLDGWLRSKGFDVSNRDRLRPLFGLKLQQEFGAHLMRVGPPILPPTTSGAVGTIYVSTAERERVGGFTPSELMVTRVKGAVWLRVTTKIAGELREQGEALRLRMEEHRDAAGPPKKKEEWQRKIDALAGHLDNDDFWIGLLDGVELQAPGGVKTVGPLGFVVGADWSDNKMRVVLQITEDALPRRRRAQSGSDDALAPADEAGAGTVSAAA